MTTPDVVPVVDRRPVLTGGAPARRTTGWLFVAACVVNGLLLWYFHDRYWYPTDDGFYAHIAERFLSGEVLNRDVQDIHPGFIHFVHAGAFWLFGIDLLSLRYPMIAAAFIGSIFVFLLLRRRDSVLAAVAAVASVALGIVHFMSPQPNWYCLALAAVLAWWLVAVPREHPGRLIGAGVLLGTLTLFRHLSGVWAAMGVISIVLLERSTNGRGRETVLARAQLGIMLIALVGYLAWSPETQPGGVILMGVWPMAVLGWLLVHIRTRNRDAASSIGLLLAGTLIPAAILLAYHVAHGSVMTLWRDLVEVAAGELRLPFYGQGWFNVLSLAGLHQAVTSFDPVRILNGLYWAVLPAASALNGILVLRHLRRGTDSTALILPVLASFYALVSLNFEGSLYLHYAVGLTVVSLLWLSASASRGTRAACGLAALILSFVSVVYHGGQTRERTSLEVLRGDRVTHLSSLVDCGVERCSVRVSPRDAATYQRFVAMIQAETAATDPILALPNGAELYFLARRRNPVRFYNGALGMVSDEDRDRVLDVLESDPPRLVIFSPADKYNTPHVADVMRVVTATYARIGTIDGAEIYRR